MTTRKPRLLFVSPVFLFPNDAGGKIRTTNVLKGLKGGAFELTLLAPAAGEQPQVWAEALGTVCDEFRAWPAGSSLPRWRRAADLLGRLPVNVAADRRPPAVAAVQAALARGGFDLVVFDFVHAAVLKPARVDAATVCFTHNVEAEIFARHAQQAANPLLAAMWRSQHRKMQRFEGAVLRDFTQVVAVSERDAQQFRQAYGLQAVSTIPTGVDLDHFAWQAPRQDGLPTVVFTGSMDWEANKDGVRHFLDDIWPRVKAGLPEARFVVVGRNPPPALVERAAALPGVSFTGFVDDVRPHVHGAQVFVIPLRVGGGTRIKAFEAMAMGCPVVSTTLGIEGLDVEEGAHYLRADDAAAFAAAVLRLLQQPQQCAQISRGARGFVEARFGHQVAAQAFERICLDALQVWRGAARAAA